MVNKEVSRQLPSERNSKTSILCKYSKEGYLASLSRCTGKQVK
jgi:hypothetical protein